MPFKVIHGQQGKLVGISEGLGKENPTKSAPTSPGPWVAATASSISGFRPASCKAC